MSLGKNIKGTKQLVDIMLKNTLDQEVAKDYSLSNRAIKKKNLVHFEFVKVIRGEKLIYFFFYIERMLIKKKNLILAAAVRRIDKTATWTAINDAITKYLRQA